MRRMIGRALSRGLLGAVALSAAALLLSPTASAEPREIAVGHEFGLGYLPYMIMEDQHLVEKRAKAMGLPLETVSWNTFGGSGFTQDALLSGRIQFASSGIPWFITLWAKNGGAIKSVGSLCSMPIYVNSRNPDVRTIRDLTEKDRIAVPSIKSSTQAIILQMAAGQAFGPDQVHKLDPLTVALNHVDGMAAMLAGGGEISAHATAPPFQEIELRDPRIHKILDSYDVNGPMSFVLGSALTSFGAANPGTVQAFARALMDANAFINANKEETAKIYVRMAGDKGLSQADVIKLLDDPQIVFTTTPQGVMRVAAFMQQIGTIKAAPKSWQEVFYEDAQALPGS